MMHPLMKQFNKYKVVQCPNCGHVQGAYSNNIFKCFKCKKLRTYIQKATKDNPTCLNLKILFHSDNPNEITEFVKRYRNAKNTGKSTGFKVFKL